MENGLIILSVTDNGIGMCSEEVSRLLTDEKRVHKHGSGVGLVNVNNRIKIVFGKVGKEDSCGLFRFIGPTEYCLS